MVKQDLIILTALPTAGILLGILARVGYKLAVRWGRWKRWRWLRRGDRAAWAKREAQWREDLRAWREHGRWGR